MTSRIAGEEQPLRMGSSFTFVTICPLPAKGQSSLCVKLYVRR
jgi:hypothetical protein